MDQKRHYGCTNVFHVHFFLSYFCFLLDLLVYFGIFSRYLQGNWKFAGNIAKQTESLKTRIRKLCQPEADQTIAVFSDHFKEQVIFGVYERHGITKKHLNDTLTN